MTILRYRILVLILVVISALAVEVGWALVFIRAAILLPLALVSLLGSDYAYEVVSLNDFADIRRRIFV